MTFLVIAWIILGLAALLDGISTVYALGKGAEERNPLFGKHPSGFRVFGQGALTIGAEIGLTWLLYSYSSLWGNIAGVGLLIQSGFHFVLAYKNFQIK